MTIFEVEHRRVLRWLWANILGASGCLWWAKRQLRRSGAVVPLTFHRVLRDADSRRTHSLPGVVLLESTYRKLVRHVVRRFDPVDLRKSEPRTRSCRLRVALTFDDGWMDTYTVALPVAREWGVPFLVFVCPQLVDQEIPFWPERLVALIRATQPSTRTKEIETLIENLKLATPEQREAYLAKLRETSQRQAGSIDSTSIDRTLSWAAIAEMHQEGIGFGSHTQTHQILTAIPLDVARQEVRTSKAAIESVLAEDCDTFAYPNGNCSPEIQNILAEAGFRLAVTTARGAWTTASDYLAIPRSNICEDNVTGRTGRFSATMFEYTTFWKAWRATKADYRLKPRTHRPATPVTV